MRAAPGAVPVGRIPAAEDGRTVQPVQHGGVYARGQPTTRGRGKQFAVLGGSEAGAFGWF